MVNNGDTTMIGYDFNGVVDTGRYAPTIEDVIITSNNSSAAKLATLEWLRDHNIICAVYFNPYAHNPIAGGCWKAEMINKLRITEFYEDDQTQYDIIRNTCPHINLIKI